MIAEKPQIFSTLQAFLDGVYEKAAQSQSSVFWRNHGHYTYADEKFSVYVTLFPKELELVFEGERVGDGVFNVTLDLCRPGGEILVGDMLSLNGECEEIKAAWAMQEKRVLTKLLDLLGN